MSILHFLYVALAVLWVTPGFLVGFSLLFGRKLNALPWLIESKGDWALIYTGVTVGLLAYNNEAGNELLYHIFLSGFFAPWIGWLVAARFGFRPLG